jgi:hypothetical protein
MVPGACVGTVGIAKRPVSCASKLPGEVTRAGHGPGDVHRQVGVLPTLSGATLIPLLQVLLLTMTN